MKRKILYVLAAAFGLQLVLTGLQSCCTTVNEAGMCRVVYGMQAEVLDNADSIAHTASGAVIAKALLLHLHLDDSMSYCRNGSSQNSGWITAAYASCRRPEYYGVVDSFIISSNHDFDAAHPAGSNLKDLFYIDREATLPDGGDFNCYLRTAPSDTATHIFSVHLVLRYENYRYAGVGAYVLDAVTQPVKLLN